MKKEYDFSKGQQGKFYRENITLNLPIYLEPDIQDFVKMAAVKKGMDIQKFVNNLLKRNIQLVKEVI